MKKANQWEKHNYMQVWGCHDEAITLYADFKKQQKTDKQINKKKKTRFKSRQLWHHIQGLPLSTWEHHTGVTGFQRMKLSSPGREREDEQERQMCCVSVHTGTTLCFWMPGRAVSQPLVLMTSVFNAQNTGPIKEAKSYRHLLCSGNQGTIDEAGIQVYPPSMFNSYFFFPLCYIGAGGLWGLQWWCLVENESHLSLLLIGDFPLGSHITWCHF